MRNKLKALLDNRIVRIILIAMVAAIAIELSIMNISAYRSMGLKAVNIAGSDASLEEGVSGLDLTTDETGWFMSDTITVGTTVKNVSVDLDTEIVPFATVTVYLTDEGDLYEYPLPEFRVTGGMPNTGLINIYPFGKVNTIRVSVSVPEGATAHINNISCNVSWPFRIRLLRVAIAALFLAITGYAWDERSYSNIANAPNGDSISKTQRLILSVVILLLIALGLALAKSNEKIVNSPWPHHKQYQELAHSLAEGTVTLPDKEVDPALLEKENPYDTLALQAEGIFFHMDYAYYEGKYYVYFGIVPELLFFYPYYLLTGKDLPNVTAMSLLWIVFVPAVFLLTGQLIRKLTKEYDIKVSFFNYIALSTGICLLSNHVYMVSRADIYNIPVMTATVLNILGLGLWLTAVSTDRTAAGLIALFFGSLSMAMVAGARPQMLLYSLAAIPLFLGKRVSEKALETNKEKQKNYISRLLEVDYLSLLCIIIPYMLIAAVVCWYNYARFGNIFDFGATYSLTTNDMNLRGFNLDRLARGLYSFFLQPASMTHDFPYLTSSAVKSGYMGRNPSEYIYGGIFVTNILTLILIAPIIIKSLRDRIPKSIKLTAILMTMASLIIAVFDVNGAGILYRYTCDVTPGIIIAALLLWLVAVDMNRGSASLAGRLLILSLCIGIGYSFLVFLGPNGSPTLKDDSVYTYELIRSYFRI